MDFDIRLAQIINQTLENDIPIYADMNVATGRKLKQLLSIVSKNAPLKPNMNKIAEMLSASRNNISDYCLYIEEAGMIAQLRINSGGIRGLGKVDKIYLIDDKTFEVGGRSKGQKQIKDIENGYIVKDDIERGYLNTISLWQLGLTY